MSDSAARLAVLLQERYGAGPVRLVAARHGLNPVFRVERRDGPPWYTRAGRVGGAVPRIARALLFLEERGVEAPRLVAAGDGAPYVEDGNRQVLVMTAVEGAAPARTPEAMLVVGAALGRLHAMGPVGRIPPLLARGGIELPALQRAGMLPAAEIAAARSWLDEVRDRVPPEHRAHFDALRDACNALGARQGLEGLDGLEGQPTVFIHGDAHYNNSILAPSGRAVYVDFDSAGPGPAIIDLGFLLLNADGGPIVAPPESPDPACVEAVIRGYCAHVTPSESELSHLADAIRFRPLVFACAAFRRAIAEGRPAESWPLDRVRAADGLAERAIAAVRARPAPAARSVADEGGWSTRRATLDDVPAVVDLFVALEREAGDPLPDDQVTAFAAALERYLREAQGSGECVVWCAEGGRDAALAGCAALIGYRAVPTLGNLDGRWGYLTRVYVVPRWRRRGIATALGHELLRAARELGLRRVMLTTTAAGAGVYRRLGFREYLGMMQANC